MLQAQGQVQNLNQRFPKSPTIPKSGETEILHFLSFLELRILATFRKPDLLVPQMFYFTLLVQKAASFLLSIHSLNQRKVAPVLTNVT